MLGGASHMTNLPIYQLQTWLIEYVRGDESNQKTAESPGRGKSALEGGCVTVNASVYSWLGEVAPFSPFHLKHLLQEKH